MMHVHHPGRSFLRRAGGANRNRRSVAGRAPTPPTRRPLVPRDANLAVVSGPSGRFHREPAALLPRPGRQHRHHLRVDRSRPGSGATRYAPLGHRSELRWSAAGLWTCLRAGWYVFGAYLGDINYWTARGCDLVQPVARHRDQGHRVRHHDGSSLAKLYQLSALVPDPSRIPRPVSRRPTTSCRRVRS